MRQWLFAAVAIFSALVALREGWLYWRRAAQPDPFVTVGRLWRRCGGLAALCVSAGLLAGFERLSERTPEVSGKAALIAAIFLSAFIALLLALRDASATTRLALRKDRDLRRESIEALSQCLEGNGAKRAGKES
jgi:hypothetical protein